MDLCEQSPSYIRAIAPYQPGKPIAELAREMGLNEKKIVKLASNENPSGISPKAKAAIKRGLAPLRRAAGVHRRRQRLERPARARRRRLSGPRPRGDVLAARLCGLPAGDP